MSSYLNHPLSPFTGKAANFNLPPGGIMPAAAVDYDPDMDAWDALRRNLTALMDAASDGLRGGPSGVLQLEAETDIGKSTLYRILDPRMKNPTQLDTLERIARAYNLQAWQLLVPRLDPIDPPTFVGAQRMSVLRSVFQQTQVAAFNDVEPHESHPAAGTAGPGARDHPHRVRSSGAADAADGVPKRRRRRDKAPRP